MEMVVKEFFRPKFTGAEDIECPQAGTSSCERLAAGLLSGLSPLLFPTMQQGSGVFRQDPALLH